MSKPGIEISDAVLEKAINAWLVGCGATGSTTYPLDHFDPTWLTDLRSKAPYLVSAWLRETLAGKTQRHFDELYAGLDRGEATEESDCETVLLFLGVSSEEEPPNGPR